MLAQLLEAMDQMPPGSLMRVFQVSQQAELYRRVPAFSEALGARGRAEIRRNPRRFKSSATHRSP